MAHATMRGRRWPGLVRSAVGLAVLAATMVVGSHPASADHDPNDTAGPLDIRTVTGRKDTASGPMSIRIRMWHAWPKRVLAGGRAGRLVVAFDVDGDGASDAVARVVRSGGRLVARVVGDGGSRSTLPVSRPDGSSVRFTVPAGAVANPSGTIGIAVRSRSRVAPACDPWCRDRAPGAGFDNVVPAEGVRYECTELIGFSQTRQWALDVAVFQERVGDASWQVRWEPGGAVYKWIDPGYAGWDGAADSGCSSRAQSPDRVVLTITSQSYETASAPFVRWIEDVIEVVRDRYPSVQRIVLQPVVGGPDDGPCPLGEGREVRATHNHPLIDAAIADVVGGDVVRGPSPEVRTCADYSDDVGHLVEEARTPIADQIADGYAA